MSYIDDLEQAAAEALAASSSATDSAQIMSDVANGDENTTVTTANGEVKTLAKAIKDIIDSIEAGVEAPQVEPQTLSAGQTTVSLTTMTTEGIAVYVEGSREFDFTVVNSTDFDFSQSFPDGTRIWVVKRDIEGVVDSFTVNTSTGSQTLSNALDQRVVYVNTLADLQALPTGGLVDGQRSATNDAGDYQWDLSNTEWSTPQYLRLTSSINFGEEIDIRRVIPYEDHSSIFDRTITKDLSQWFNLAIQDGAPIYVPPGMYTLSTKITNALKQVSIRGAGIGLTDFKMLAYIPGFEIVGPSGSYIPVSLKGFSIGRDDANGFGGIISDKNILVRYANGVRLSDIESYGNIGFSVNVMDATDVVSRGLMVHDSKGNGDSQVSGTDGIHYTRVKHGWVLNSHVWNVGDDPISTGSYTSGDENKNEKIVYSHNMARHCHGGMKFYGNFSDGLMQGNRSYDLPGPGAYVIYEDRDAGESYDQTDIDILGNYASECGGSGAGGAISLFSPQGNGSATMRRIRAMGNIIENCPYGITAVSYDRSIKSYEDIHFDRNIILDTTNDAMTMNALVGRKSSMNHNTIERCGGYASFVNDCEAGIEFDYIDNSVEDAQTGLSNDRAVWIRPGSIRNKYNVVNNTFGRCGTASSPATALLVAANVSPVSKISNNEYDPASSNGIGYPSSGYVAKQTYSPSAPTTGTHQLGKRVMNDAPSTGSPVGWVVEQGGTFGTLSSVTGSITSGTKLLTVSDASNLADGMYITIAGVSGRFHIRDVNYDTLDVTLDSNADATVSGASVSYSAPTITALPNL